MKEIEELKEKAEQAAELTDDALDAVSGGKIVEQKTEKPLGK